APPEKELIAALQQYAREGLPLQRRIVRLREDFGYKIGTTKFKALQNKYNIARVRKPPPRPIATTLICKKIAEDTDHCKGPNQIKAILATEGYQIPR
ncbi:uncharacterized protein TRAVEDRAFT_83160, partial [Trametes versicolor FP-101664 SS1]|uniref:uncharacterized protein n=1 Tax=Trametes versicolor (strain FP-101664) TaxID=717944 RepID=UPI00046247CC